MEKDKDYFDTADYFAASILTIELKEEPEYLSRGTKVVCRYTRREQIYQILNRYTSGELKVTAIQFAETIRRIRGEIVRRSRAVDNNG